MSVYLDGPPPIGRVEIPLAPGPAYLYGLNGVGKSKLVRAVRDVLCGRHPAGAKAAGLIAAIDEHQGPEPPGFARALAKVAADAVFTGSARNAAAMGSWWDDLPDPNSDDHRSFASLAGELLLTEVDDSTVDESQIQDLWSDIACGYVVLQPSRHDPPGWTVFAAAPIGDEESITRAWYLSRCLGAASRVNSGILGLQDAAPGEAPDAWAPDVFVDVFRDIRFTDEGLVLEAPLVDVVPVVEVGRIETPPVDVLEVDPSTELDLDAMTRSIVLGDTKQRLPTPSWVSLPQNRIVEATADDDVELVGEVTANAVHLSELASFNYRLLLEDAGLVRFELGHPDDWAVGNLPHWEAHDQPSDTWVLFRDLSTAQRRWATLAVRLALRREAPDAPLVVLGDEPELALHRRAERHLAAGLSELAHANDSFSLMSTHSPTLIAHQAALAWHCERDESGQLRVATMNSPLSTWHDLEATATSLGINTVDLLTMIRVFVVVEGAHDEAVFDQLIGDELSRAQAHLLRLNGAKRLDALTASELLAFSDAPLVVVLDGIHEATTDCWNTAVDAASTGDTRTAARALDDLGRKRGGEPKWLADLGRRTLDNGRITRVTVHGLHEPDIICYLPPAPFTGGQDDWQPVLAEWREQTDHDLKGWLRETHGVHISRKTVSAAAESMTEVPGEFQRLARSIRELSGPASV